MQITLKNYPKLLSQIQKTIQETGENIVKTVSQQKVKMSWEVGQKIDQHLEGLEKNHDSKYGKKLLEKLEEDTGIVARTLYQMHNFYKAYPTLPQQKNKLSWSHYRNLVSVKDDTKRQLLEDLTIKNNLGADRLQREIVKSNSAEKGKSSRGKNSAKSVKFKVTRGQLFTYKIAQILKQVQDDKESRAHSRHPELVSGSSSKTFVDLGFNMFCEIKTSLQGEAIVESKKSGEKISLKKSSTKPAQMHTYKAYLERVVDGDTIHVILDLGFKIQHREILRLGKINAPEMKTPAGKRSSDALKKILKDVPLLIVKTNKTDIYGRYVADVFFDESGKETNLQKIADSGTYLSQLLLDRGLVEVF